MTAQFRTARYNAHGVERVLYTQSAPATFDEIRAVLDIFAAMAPADYCPYPQSRVAFRFGTFKIGCLENSEAVHKLADRFKKPANNNISGFKFPSRAGGFSRKNVTTIDEHLLAFEF